MEYVLIRDRVVLNREYLENPREVNVDFKRCEIVSMRIYLEGGDLAIDGTILCPAEYEEELRKAGFKVLGKYTEDEAKKLPRFTVLDGIEFVPV